MKKQQQYISKYISIFLNKERKYREYFINIKFLYYYKIP